MRKKLIVVTKNYKNYVVDHDYDSVGYWSVDHDYDSVEH